MAGKRTAIEDRLASKIMPIPHCGCWIWVGEVDPRGYGRFYHWENGRSKARLAHRIVYEHYLGAIPDGLDLDHKCRTPSCVNPDHLDPVTHAENMARGIHATKSHCVHGHPLSGKNLERRKDRPNARVCRACRVDRVAKVLAENPSYHTRAARRARQGRVQ